jgi:hypothetical protein
MGIRREEKRNSSRLNLRIPIAYHIRGKPEFNHTISDNISISGIGCVSQQFIAPETLVMLEINLLSQMLRPIGRIAWASPFAHSDRYRLGIEFLEFTQKEKGSLADYIDMQLKE